MPRPIPSSSAPIVNGKGWATPELISLLQALASTEPMEGEGTPEGSVSANPKTLYFRTDGSSGSILYIKKTGSGNTGWVAV